jgi:hypothetical protein
MTGINASKIIQNLEFLNYLRDVSAVGKYRNPREI